jgi:hypothetical protein
MVQCSMRSFRVKRIDDDSPLVPAEWPSTTSHNMKVFEEIRPNTRMMKKIYMVLYYERSKLSNNDPNKIINVYDIPITSQILRRILFNTDQTHKFAKLKKNNDYLGRKKYKTLSLEEYQKKIDKDAPNREEISKMKNYKGLNIEKKKIEITFD